MAEPIIHHLSRTPECGARARRLLERELSPRVDPRVLDDARTVVSELVNNAYLHGSGNIELRLQTSTDHLRVEVVDQGSGAAVDVRQAGLHGGGQGLRIVQALSSHWGAFEGTTHVWAELALDPTDRALGVQPPTLGASVARRRFSASSPARRRRAAPAALDSEKSGTGAGGDSDCRKLPLHDRFSGEGAICLHTCRISRTQAARRTRAARRTGWAIAGCPGPTPGTERESNSTNLIEIICYADSCVPRQPDHA